MLASKRIGLIYVIVNVMNQYPFRTTNFVYSTFEMLFINRPARERNVKRLRLSKALTLPNGTTVADALCRMATRRVDAALLTDASALLCGIITDNVHSPGRALAEIH